MPANGMRMACGAGAPGSESASVVSHQFDGAGAILISIISSMIESNHPYKSRRLGLSFLYDWSNPDIPDDALIRNVLDRGIFHDVAVVCIHYGIDRVRGVWMDMEPDQFRDLATSRMLKNIEKGMSDES